MIDHTRGKQANHSTTVGDAVLYVFRLLLPLGNIKKQVIESY
jgi:hypothetical protein